jgi:hypothetical protein
MRALLLLVARDKEALSGQLSAISKNPGKNCLLIANISS